MVMAAHKGQSSWGKRSVPSLVIHTPHNPLTSNPSCRSNPSNFQFTTRTATSKREGHVSPGLVILARTRKPGYSRSFRWRTLKVCLINFITEYIQTIVFIFIVILTNISADMSFGLLKVFHVELGSLPAQSAGSV